MEVCDSLGRVPEIDVIVVLRLHLNDDLLRARRNDEAVQLLNRDHALRLSEARAFEIVDGATRHDKVAILTRKENTHQILIKRQGAVSRQATHKTWTLQFAARNDRKPSTTKTQTLPGSSRSG